jgi:alpha-L-rhamnosidase
MTVHLFHNKRANKIQACGKTYGLYPALTLACALALPAYADKSAPRPPTLDPTYGLRPPVSRVQSEYNPKTDAQWVWADTTADDQTVALRGAFSQAQTPGRATIYVTADDFFTLYVNGKQVAQSVPIPQDTFVWKHVYREDITSLLKVGPNVIALKAVNTGGAAGAIARLEVDGKPVLLTGSQWKVFDQKPQSSQALPANWTNAAFDDSKWANARVVGDITADPWAGAGGLEGWPGYDNSAPYMAHITLPPAALLNAQNGLGKIESNADTPGEFFVTLAPSSRDVAPSIIVDFGKEIAGRVEVSGESGRSFTVYAGTGESQEEAEKAPWGGAHRIEVADGKLAYSPYSAFRYARLTFPTIAPPSRGANGRFQVRVAVDHKYYPVEYKGSFACSDALMTRIWYAGAYTAHLCMQEDIWDAPKRDRARWMGDLHVSGAVINLAFADSFLMEQTMQRLRDEAQGGNTPSATPKQHVNGIPGYSCAWVCGLADFHRHIGDYDYLNRQHDALISLLDYLQGELDGRQVFANIRKAWPFVDWAPEFNKDTPHARAATHLFMVKAAREAVFLLYEMGDAANAKKYSGWADSLAEAAQRNLADLHSYTFGDRRQDNAMAIYAGVATKEQTQAIYDKILAPTSPAWNLVATPYYNNYVIYAMSLAGHNAATLGLIRNYWGGMLNEGATSWWEGYDPKWEKKDFHAHLQADDGTGYFVSLAHGWSAGPTSWLTERVLGVRPTTGGFKSVDIAPDLGDLQWAEGDVPTPQGTLHVRVDKRAFGLVLKAHVPKGIKATLIVPGKTISVRGPKEVTLKSPVIPPPKPL